MKNYFIIDCLNIQKIICSYRKAHSKHHASFKLLQPWQKESDEKSMVATVVMDLSNTYDCIPHDLLIAKLSAYSIDSMGLVLVSDYLSHHKQRTKIGSSYSSWHDIIRGFTRVFTGALYSVREKLKMLFQTEKPISLV